MDARDFKYISDSMPQLSVLDISGVTIEEYSDREPLFANFTYYPADELPKYSLMGKPLTSVSLPSTLTSIGEAAFAGCAELTEISLPSTVATIGNYAFSSASKLADVKGGEGVRTIGDYAFSDWTTVREIVIPSTVEYIGDRAMRNWNSLAELTSNAVTPPSLGDNVWENVDYEKVNLTVPAAGEMAYRLAEQWQDFFKSSSAKPLAAESLRVAVDGDVVTITSDEEISTVQLFDMSGILLQSAAPHSQQFSLTLSGYSGRAYVVRCVSGGNEKIIKISRQ